MQTQFLSLSRVYFLRISFGFYPMRNEHLATSFNLEKLAMGKRTLRQV